MSLGLVKLQRSVRQWTRLTSLCHRCQTHLNQSIRTSMVFTRLNEAPHHPELPLLERDPLKKRHAEVKIVDDDNRRPQGNMTVILKYDIEGLGYKGDVLTVTKRIGRTILLPAEVAVYASPENLARNAEEIKNEPEKRKRSIWSQKTIRMLEKMHLPISMSSERPWKLTKSRVRVALRQEGVILDEDCIQLPETPITEFGPFTIQVTVNKTDTVSVSGTLYEWTEDEKNRPTQPVWNHDDVTLCDVVVEVMRKNNLVRGTPAKEPPVFKSDIPDPYKIKQFKHYHQERLGSIDE